MAEDDLLDLELDDSTPQDENNNKVEKRIKDLSGKVKTTAEERDAERVKSQQLETEKAVALKDAEFYKNFNATASKYQGAADYQDKIKELTDKGYELEDATISILAKEGKYTPPPTPQPPRESPAGGSAPTQLKTGGAKTVGEMTQEERRAELMEAEKRGDIGLT